MVKKHADLVGSCIALVVILGIIFGGGYLVLKFSQGINVLNNFYFYLFLFIYIVWFGIQGYILIFRKLIKYRLFLTILNLLLMIIPLIIQSRVGRIGIVLFTLFIFLGGILLMIWMIVNIMEIRKNKA